MDLINTLLGKKKPQDKAKTAPLLQQVLGLPIAQTPPGVKAPSVGDALSYLINGAKSVAKTAAKMPLVQTLPGSNSTSPTVGQTANFIADSTYRPPARVGFQAMQTLAGDNNTYKPSSPFEKLLFGAQPLQNYPQQTQELSQFGQKHGVPQGVANTIAPGIVAGGVALDMLPVNPIKAGEKEVAKEAPELLKVLFKDAAKDSPEMATAGKAFTQRTTEFQSTLSKLQNAQKSVPNPQSMTRIFQSLDGANLMLTAKESKAADTIKSILDLPKDTPLTKHVPQLQNPQAQENIFQGVYNVIKSKYEKDVMPLAQGLRDKVASFNPIDEKLGGEMSSLRRTRPGDYTNLREIDNPLINGQPFKKTIQATQNGLGQDSAELAGQGAKKGEDPAWLRQDSSSHGTPLEALRATETRSQALLQDRPTLAKEHLSFDDIIHNSSITPKEKIGVFDYLRTPDRVLQKIGLGHEASELRDAHNAYLKELPQEIDRITKWSKQADSPQSAQSIFKYLDGQKISLSDNDLKVAHEVKDYLSNFADRLGLPKDKRITSYITHIFDRELATKEFDPEIAKLIRDKVPGSVYDPFTTQRLGMQGYIEDAWRSLDAYVKRGVRKVNLDPVLEKIAGKAGNLEDSQFRYVKRYIDRVNMRPTEVDNLLDNTIKQVVGYKFGQRPTTVLTQKLRQAVYRGTLGLNVGSMLKNVTQGTNTLAKLGEKYTAIGYTNFAKSIMTHSNELEEVGALGKDLIQDRTLNATRKFWQTADKGLFAFFEGAEKLNRGAAYFGAKAKAIANGATEEEAVNSALKTVRDTQFQFGSIDTPQILQSDIAKTLGQFQSFNLKQAEFLTEMAKNKEFAGLIRYFGYSTLLALTVGKSFGMKPSDMIPFWGVATGQTKLGQTPPIKLGEDLVGAVTGAKNQYGQVPSVIDRAKTIGNDLVPFVPAGVQARKSLQGLQAYTQGASKTASGNTRFEVPHSTANLVKSVTLGQYSTPQGQAYISNGMKPTSKAETFLSSLKTMPKEDAAKKFAELKVTNPSLYSSVIQQIKDQALHVTQDESKLKNMTVANRAEEINKQISKLSSKEEKAKLLSNYAQKGIVTDRVMLELVKLGKENQHQKNESIFQKVEGMISQ